MKLQAKSKLLSLHGKMELTDEQENIVYTVESKAISIHNKTYVHDAEGREVAYISRKPISLHETHIVEMADGTDFEVRSEWFHIKDVIDIEELGWTLHGDFLSHNYTVHNAEDRVIASTHMKWFSMHHISYLDIEDDSQADLIVALYVTLERILIDREAAASAAGASTAGASGSAGAGNNAEN